MSETSNNHPNIRTVIESPVIAGGTPPAEDAPEQPKTPNKKRRNIVLGAIGVVAAGTLAATLAVGLGSNNQPRGAQPPKAVESSAPADPTPEATTPTPEATNATGEFKGEVLTQTTSIEDMDAITDLGEFAKLSYADRLAYALNATPDMGIATPDNDLGYEDTSMIPGYYWQQLGSMSMNTTDKLKSEKAISALYYYTTNLQTGEIDDTYTQVITSVEQNAGEGVSNATTKVFEDSGKWQSGLDRSGNPIDFVNITSYDGDSATGDQIAPSKTFQTIRQEVKLLNGKTVIFYPMAYGIDGKVSPDKAYDY